MTFERRCKRCCGVSGVAATKLHWSDLQSRQQRESARRLAEVDGLHVVAVGAPVPPRRQERARALCLRRLVVELHDRGVRQLQMEARAPELNARDVRTTAAARFLLPRGSQFWIEHVSGLQEPALWAADLVAGTVRAHRLGDPVCREVLAGNLREIEVVTDL